MQNKINGYPARRIGPIIIIHIINIKIIQIKINKIKIIQINTYLIMMRVVITIWMDLVPRCIGDDDWLFCFQLLLKLTLNKEKSEDIEGRTF